MVALLELTILVIAMAAACAIGFWVAQNHLRSRWHATNQTVNKMAQTIGQLREDASSDMAEKSLALIVSDRDRARVAAWRGTPQGSSE